jgi:hypothetical protein
MKLKPLVVYNKILRDERPVDRKFCSVGTHLHIAAVIATDGVYEDKFYIISPASNGKK